MNKLREHLQAAITNINQAIEEVQNGVALDEDEASLLAQLIEDSKRMRDNMIRYESHTGGLSTKQLAAKYLLSSTRVWQIVNAQTGEVISDATNIKTKSRLLELGSSALTDIRGVRIVESLRQKIAVAGMGVTLQGTLLTVRFSEGKALQQVSMQVSSIIDSEVKED